MVYGYLYFSTMVIAKSKIITENVYRKKTMAEKKLIIFEISRYTWEKDV